MGARGIRAGGRFLEGERESPLIHRSSPSILHLEEGTILSVVVIRSFLLRLVGEREREMYIIVV